MPETHYALNLSIARGLDYYTGTVYETTLNDHPQIGSICSGGRYENLASQYTKSKLPGVGISIGLTRLYWQLREAGLINTAQSTVDVLVTQMDPAAAAGLPGAWPTSCAAPASPPRWCWKPASWASSSSTPTAPASASCSCWARTSWRKGVVTVKDLRREDQFEVARGELIKTLRVELEQAAAMG